MREPGQTGAAGVPDRRGAGRGGGRGPGLWPGGPPGGRQRDYGPHRGGVDEETAVGFDGFDADGDAAVGQISESACAESRREGDLAAEDRGDVDRDGGCREGAFDADELVVGVVDDSEVDAFGSVLFESVVDLAIEREELLGNAGKWHGRLFFEG